MVRTLVVADEVDPRLDLAFLRRLAPELVLGAGDLPWSFLEYLSSAVNAPVVFVPGNHDAELDSGRRARSGLWTRGGFPCDDPRPLGADCVDGIVTEVAGIRIAGLGGCVRYSPGPHQYTQSQYQRRAKRLIRAAQRGPRVDVLLTHAPPFGLGDEDDPPHRGIEALHDVIAALQPKWLLHGHIHPYGTPRPDRQVGATTIRNVVPFAILDIAIPEGP